MTEMFGEAWSPMSVPDLAPDDDDDDSFYLAASSTPIYFLPSCPFLWLSGVVFHLVISLTSTDFLFT